MPTGESWLEAQRWEGNVRELENVVHRSFLLASVRVLGAADFARAAEAGGPVSVSCPHESTFDQARKVVVDAFERSYLTALMTRSRGNVSEAARLASKERRTLGRLLRKHRIDAGDYRPDS